MTQRYGPSRSANSCRLFCRFGLETGFVLALLVLCKAAEAVALASFDRAVGASNSSAHEYALFYGPSHTSPTIELGDDLAVFSLSDVIGTTIVVDASNDPEFAAFVAAITDGSAPDPDRFGVKTTVSPSGVVVASSSTPFGECVTITTYLLGTCVGTTDLAGYMIDSVSFELTNVEPYSTSGLKTYVTVAIQGTLIPEPSTALLLAAGLAGLAVRGRKKA